MKKRLTHQSLTVYMETYCSCTVRKQLKLTDNKTTSKTRLIYLLEDEFESEPKIRIVIPPSHRYQAMLAVHVQEHWGVQRTMQQVQMVFYWPGWRNDTSVFVTECAGCLHIEQINLKDVVPHEDRAKNVNASYASTLWVPYLCQLIKINIF